jgi:hypothetical protein
MKKIILIFLLMFPLSVHADFWGGDLPLLAEIVTNTLNTLYELQRQTGLLKDEMDGINDTINRVKTISDIVQPSTWDQWRNPAEALRRLEQIYYTIPKEYRTEKSDVVEGEISQAMNMVSRLTPEIRTSFLSGKELERRGADASPGVAQKLTASGVGSLVALESQTQAIQSHIASLLAQMLAQTNESESRRLVSTGETFANVSENLGSSDSRFLSHILPLGIRQ